MIKLFSAILVFVSLITGASAQSEAVYSCTLFTSISDAQTGQIEIHFSSPEFEMSEDQDVATFDVVGEATTTRYKIKVKRRCSEKECSWESSLVSGQTPLFSSFTMNSLNQPYVNFGAMMGQGNIMNLSCNL